MHRTRLVTALILALGLCASSQGSRAAEANEDTAFQKRIFGRVMAGKKIHACYERVYDEDVQPHMCSRGLTLTDFLAG